MPRITISIPVDLKQRLEDPLVKKSINISRTCQEALARVVHRLLDLPADLKRMEKLLSRLRRDHERSQDKWLSEGSAAAREWAEHEASYGLLQRLGKASLEERMSILRRAPPGPLRELLQRYRERDDFLEESFLEGWALLTGLLWEVVKKTV